MLAILAMMMAQPNVNAITEIAVNRSDALGIHRMNQAQAGRLAYAVIDASKRYRIPQDLILAIIEVESAYAPNGQSNAACIGLMQINPKTAPHIAASVGMKHYQLARIEHNIILGVAYLRELLDTYRRTDWALTAFNRGPGSFERHGKKVNRYAKRVLGKRPMLRRMLKNEIL